MIRKSLLISLLAILSIASRAAYIPVAVTGYNADVVANGAGSAAISAPQDVDGANYAFMAPDFNPAGTLPTSFLPATGLINSAATSGLTYQLAPYTGNNCLRLSGTATGTLTFSTPTAAGEVYVLATGGSGTCTDTITVTFTDATTQVFNNQVINDWYSGTGYAIQGLGRVNKTTNVIENSTTNPRLYQLKLTLLSTNYTKQIASIKFANSGAVLNVMGITIATVCTGSPLAGAVATTSGPTACSGVNFTLSLPTAPVGIGITYQWQSSPTGNAPWTTIAAATNSTYTTAQTATTAYRAYISCNGSTADTSTVVNIGMTPPLQCYCVPVAADNSYAITNFTTIGAITNVNNTSAAGITSTGYSNYYSTLNISAMQGGIVNFTSTYTGSTNFGTKIYIDYNQNGDFTDAGETVYTSSAYATVQSGSFQVSPTALTGTTRLRIRIYNASTTGPSSPCGSIGGSEAEDYAFTIVAMPACSGTPSAGTTTTSATAVCATDAFTLTSSNGNAGGLTHQWQTSIDGGFTWNDIVGATTNPYTVTGQAVATQYRDKQACTTSPFVYSSTVTVGTRTCYCSPSFTNGCSTWRLTNVTFGNINNSPSTCTNSNYTSLSATVTAGTPFPMSITTSQFCSATVYLDFNNDGDFNDFDEMLYQEPYSGANTSTVTPNVLVPGYVPAGAYRMRVFCKWGGGAGVGEACNAFPSASYGNFHDYTLMVQAGTPCIQPTAQPTALVLTASTSLVNVSFTAASPATDRYLIVRSQGAALNTAPVNGVLYPVGATLGNGIVISSSGALAMTDLNVTPGAVYVYTIFGHNASCVGGPLYTTAPPLTGNVTVPGVTTYSWNGSVSNNWTTPANWTPARLIPDMNDILRFDNGIVDTANNIPNQTIKRLVFTNNTTAYLQAAASGSTLTISDTVAATNDLDISSGSSFISNGTAGVLTVAFSGANNKTQIAGNLESISTTVVNLFNLANTTATVTASGSIIGSGTTNTASFTGTTVTNLQVNGTYKHNYTTVSGPAVPTASWNTGSTMLIAGYTSATGGPNGGLNQIFYNVTYNCPLQTTNTNWSGTGPLTATNNLTVTSTGTGTWQLSSTQGYQYVTKNYIQTGGTLNLCSGTATAVPTLNVSGDFTQSGGTFTNTGTSTTNVAVLNFNGTTVQNVSFFNAAPVGFITYRISNNAGINLTGTGTLTSAFNINTNGGVRISTTATNPINTTLALTYATGTTLTYDTTGSCTMTATVFPTTSGPQNLTIATGNSNNVVTMPFSRTVPNILNMTSGDINLGTNTLTLGTSATAAGTLTYNAGNIRITTGSMVRWYGITGLPTAVGNAGLYPIAYGSLSRAVNLYFATGTALSTGGTIGVGHTNVSGFTPVTITDGAYSVTQRTNSFWSFTTGNGIVASGTIGARISGNGLLTAVTPADLRMVQATAVAGTYVAGSAPANAQRTGFTIADLALPYYIGSALTNMTGVYVAVNSGPWSVGSTWDVGSAPTIANDAYINSGVTVTADAATNAAKSLTILPSGTLTAAAATATVTIDSALQNNGNVNVTGSTIIVNGNTGLTGITNNAGAFFNIGSGTVRLGPVNGSNKPFANNGTLSVTGGTLNINGNLALNANSTFNQSGGDINVDGNAGNVLANSVASGTKIVNILTPNVTLTAGNFTIVDPHLGASTNTLEYNVATTSVNASGTHTFRTGNGISTDTGFNASYGFSVNTAVTTGRLAFKNVVVNSGTAANSWLVLGAGSTGVLGDFTVNAGGEYRQGGTGSIVYIAGNLVNNGTYSALGTTYFGNYISGTISSSLAAQSVSGTGTFRNLLTAPTAKFYKIQVNNNFNVTFNIGDVPFSNNVILTAATGGPSRIIMPGTTTLNELAGAGITSSATAGWVVGRYQKAAAVGGMNHTLPIGDLIYYAPLNISGTAATAGAVRASTTTGDHPALGTSTINPLASVNRYYTIDTLNGLTYTTGTIITTFNWNAVPDMDPALTPGNLVIGNYRGTTWSYPAVTTPTATSIKTGVVNDAVGQYVIGENCGPVAIVTQPVNKTACLGAPISFTVGATPKAGATFQWKKGTTNISGATDSIYTIPAVAAGDAGSYSVVVGSGCASVTTVTSATVTLTINTPAVITTQPAATQAICEGSPATMSVTATGTNLTYQWKKNGLAITSATAATYIIPVVAPSDAGTYSVDVIGATPCGTATSVNSVLTVKPLPLTITAATAINFCPGGSVVLNAPVTTPTNTLTYQWQNNTTNIPGQTGGAYTATATGSYTAVVTNTANGCSNTSNAIAVSVNGAPQSTITPANTAVFCQNGSVLLHGLTTGGLTYEWSLNGTPIPGATDSTYAATAVGNYTLKVSIGSGCFTTSTITAVSMNTLPVVTTTPAGNQAICLNDTLTINTIAPNASVIWKLNGTPVVPAATGNTYKATLAGSYTVTATSTITGCVNTSAALTVVVNPLPAVTVTSINAASFCEGGTDTLRAAPTTGLSYLWNRNGSAITPAATTFQYVASLSGNYTVTVTDGNGCKRTSTATTVTANPLPNVIITPSLPLAMCQGQTNNFCVPAVTGLTYQWMNSNVNIPGATSACYGVTAAGSYSVTVTNTATGCTATSTASATTVSPIPAATIVNPGTGIACAGDTICLNANTGAGLSYQWKQNGNNIIGATNATYCVTNSGNYTVTVTNANNCSVTSAITILNFNPRPTATISYTTPVTFCEGGAVVLTGISNIGTTYQWQNNGSTIGGATSNNFIASSTGSYSVIITAPNGCSTVSPTILVVSNPLPVPVITRNGGILSTGNYASYQWYFNSTPISGATFQSHNVTQNGAYSVFVTDFNNCTNYSPVYFFNNVGVGGPQLNPASIKVFPNPVRSVVNIEAPAQVNVTVRDLTGRMVMKLDNAKQLDMSKLAEGAYMLMISDKSGIIVKMEKVMKISE